MNPEGDLEMLGKEVEGDVRSNVSIPFLFVYFLWWARNSAIFQNIQILGEVVAGFDY
jgi:hypothetical protein